MWYHNEPPVPGGRTAPRIGECSSTDDGLHWRDLGIVVEAAVRLEQSEIGPNSTSWAATAISRTGGHEKEFIYCFHHIYHKDTAEQGIAVARMRYEDRDDPVGKVIQMARRQLDAGRLGGT